MQKCIIGDETGDFGLCLTGYTGREVIAHLTDGIPSLHLTRWVW